MIFSPALTRQIQAGRKTVTRRHVKGDTCRYKPGHTYAVQPGRGKSEAARILVTGVRVDLLGAVTFADARAEGFRTTDQFKAYWVRMHDAWAKRQEKKDEELEEGRLVQRFDTHHANKAVWVIDFLPQVDPVRLLADRHVKASYVDNRFRAMPDEPEAVDEQTQERLTKEGWLKDEQHQALERVKRERELGELTLGERLDRAIASMREDRRSASSEVRVIERRVSAVERKAYRDAA